MAADSFWRGRRVLVTGATGVVGSQLTKELVDLGAYVVTLIRDVGPRSELYRSGYIQRVAVVSGHLEDLWTLERAINKHEIETVFHLGAQTIVGVAHRAPLPTFEANVRGTWIVLEACRLHRDLVKQVVIASSDKAYGEQSKLPYTEDMPLMGRHPYEVSKSCADLIAQSYHHTYGLPVATSRCGNIYGGCDLNWSRIVPGTIRSFLRGERPIVRSDGTYVRDYIYVKDVICAYLTLAENLNSCHVQGEAFNFSTESPIRVLDIINTIRTLMNCQHIEPLVLNKAEGELLTQYLSSQKAKRVLNWAPKFTLEEGLRETISWYETFLG